MLTAAAGGLRGSPPGLCRVGATAASAAGAANRAGSGIDTFSGPV
jgi:hypothetical protein